MNSTIHRTNHDESEPTSSHLPAVPGRFVAHEVALEAAAFVVEGLRKVSGPYGDLVRQTRRAVVSVPLNLAEGAGRAGRDPVQHFRIVYGSAKEAVAAIRLMGALGGIDEVFVERALGLLDRVCALCWRLIRSPGSPR